MANQVGLAPELGDVVTAAQAELQQAIQIGSLRDDPLRHVLQALSTHLGALHKVLTDGSLTLAQHIEAARQPVQDEQLRRAVVAGVSTHTGAAIRAIRARTILIVAGVMLGVTLVGMGAGYWLGREAGFIAGSATAMRANATLSLLPPSEGAVWARLIANNPGSIAASMQQCEKVITTTADGRKSCALPVWAEPARVPMR
jgi:hypothetical protein